MLPTTEAYPTWSKGPGFVGLMGTPSHKLLPFIDDDHGLPLVER